MFLLTDRISNNVSMASSVFSRCYKKDRVATLRIVNIFLENAKIITEEKLNEIGFDNRSNRSLMLEIDGLVREMLTGRMDEVRFNHLVIKINHFKNIEHDIFGKQIHEQLSYVADFDLKNWDVMSIMEQDYLIKIVKDMSSYRAEGRIDPVLVDYYKETDSKFQELIATI